MHISGIPGSGKTTIGQKFSGLEGVIVVDTDELITDEDQKEMMKVDKKGPPEDIHKLYREKWEEIFRKALIEEYHKAETKNARLLIFTGILNQMSPPPGMVVPMPFADIEKYFLDVPLPQLLRQFYGRYTKEMNDDQEWWQGVASGRYRIPSSRTYLKSLALEKHWHVRHGYTLMTHTDVEHRIRETLGLHQARQKISIL